MRALRCKTTLPVLASIAVAALVGTAAAGAAPASAPTPTPASASPPTIPDTMQQRLQPCTVCHGEQGRSTNDGYFPRIAGKPAAYLYNQLVNFRIGRRQNAAMTRLVDSMSDGYLREIAAHFASLELPYPPPVARETAPALLARGAALVSDGDPQRGIPACNDCHGSAMTGVLPAVPGLLGLPRDYLLAQLGGWRTGQRRAAEPDCMATVARRLAIEDAEAVASWLASRPVPADPRPASAAPLPASRLECGSGTR